MIIIIQSADSKDFANFLYPSYHQLLSAGLPNYTIDKYKLFNVIYIIDR